MHKQWKSLFFMVCVAALGILAAPRISHACSFVPLTEHELDAEEQQIDTTPPAPPELDEVMLIRRPASSSACGGAVNSCDGSGQVGIALLPTADDRSPADQIGYLVELVDGSLPGNLYIPEQPVRQIDGGALWFVFSDEDQEFEFSVSIRAVDLAGNMSEPILVEVFSGNSGCSATSNNRALGTWGVVLFALLWAVRRWRPDSASRSSA